MESVSQPPARYGIDGQDHSGLGRADFEERDDDQNSGGEPADRVASFDELRRSA